MKNVICAAAQAGLVLAAPASAHHSYAMFDQTRDTVLTGIVQEWQWANPHILLVVVAPDDKGKLVPWTLEGSSTAVLRERGWGRAIVKVGDRVTVHMAPLKDGSKGGQLNNMTAPDGKNYDMNLKP